jgi:uncharacterized protein YuzE
MVSSNDLWARAVAPRTMQGVFSKRSTPHTPVAPVEEPAPASGPLRYDSANDLVVVLVAGTDDLTQACPADSDDICVLWENGKVVGVAVSNASSHLAPELLEGCQSLDILGLGHF